MSSRRGPCRARRILLNLEISDDARAAFAGCQAGTADELVPRWVA